MPVVVMQPSGHTTISGSRNGPNSHLCLSIMTFLFLNPIFGLVALVFSVMSKVAAPVDWESARIKGRIAMFISITGIVISVVAGVIVVLVFYTRDS
ncbi:hypothetical protein LSH36_803g00014 [Paralvinella palmiformis]|uniref:Uncharacterized protein n=1 Tax=Paralvinella palmiformis TaxID=53620 RepID=A0AAD9IZR2_9ANNE|nr:hypothetical protein LSH36_803g00014 [Paralvinella palmiformis]